MSVESADAQTISVRRRRSGACERVKTIGASDVFEISDKTTEYHCLQDASKIVTNENLDSLERQFDPFHGVETCEKIPCELASSTLKFQTLS